MICAAKSSEDLRGSIPDQLRECRELIAGDLGREVAGEYEDESFSAYQGDRGPDLVEAMRHAEELVAEHGRAELWVQHSDRLARGDGVRARHTVEIGLWALKRGVTVRCVQDPDTFRDLLYAVVTGQRNHEDSHRRGLAMAAGRRRAAERGEFIGYLPDGYKLTVEIDDRGRVRKRMVIDPARQPVVEMVFRLALRDRTTGQIAQSLNRHGWVTKPGRKDAVAAGWTSSSVLHVLRNPRYAGLVPFAGRIVARDASPAYITERQHHRILGLIDARTPDQLEAMLIASLRTLLTPDQSVLTADPEPVVDLAWERQRLRDASHQDERSFQLALEALLARRREMELSIEQAPSQRLRRQLEAVGRFEAWAAEELTGRSEHTRAATAELTGLLGRWFTQITIDVAAREVTVGVVRRFPADTPRAMRQATVRFDRLDWTRVACLVGRRRFRCAAWDDVEILGAMQAWAEVHGRPPTSQDWVNGDGTWPTNKTVYRHFRSWRGPRSATPA